MTPTREWDGLPENPEREGWHWLRRHSGGGPEAWLWTDCDGAEGEFQWLEEGGDGDPDTQSRWFEYLGPCLMPDEQRALLARAEQAEAARDDAIREMVAMARQAGAWQGIADGKDVVIRQIEAERDAARAEAARLRRGWLATIQTENSCPATGGGCLAKRCGCVEEMKLLMREDDARAALATEARDE